jgi:hypothetical protein
MQDCSLVLGHSKNHFRPAHKLIWPIVRKKNNFHQCHGTTSMFVTPKARAGATVSGVGPVIIQVALSQSDVTA